MPHINAGDLIRVTGSTGTVLADMVQALDAMNMPRRGSRYLRIEDYPGHVQWLYITMGTAVDVLIPAHPNCGRNGA